LGAIGLLTVSGKALAVSSLLRPCRGGPWWRGRSCPLSLGAPTDQPGGHGL